MTKEELLAVPIGVPNVSGGYVHFYEVNRTHKKLSSAIKRVNEFAEILDKIRLAHPDVFVRLSPQYSSDRDFDSNSPKFMSAVRFSVPIKGD